MTSIELQRQMLKHGMSVNDLAFELHITRNEVKKFANGQREVPAWIEKFFGDLNAKAGQSSGS